MNFRTTPYFWGIEFKSAFNFGILVFLMWFYLLPCFSHEEEPSILDFELQPSTVFIKIQIDAKVLFGEESRKYDLLDSDLDLDLAGVIPTDSVSIKAFSELIYKN